MAAIITRETAGTGATVKNSPLTNAEIDQNFININSELTNININDTYSGIVDVTGSVRSEIKPVSALNIDCSTGNFFTKTINSNSTFTVSNVPIGKAYSFVLEVTHTAGSITWFSGVVWPQNIAPILTTGKVHLFVFLTDDGGTTWKGSSQTNYNS